MEIVAVKKDTNDVITEFKLDNGNIVDLPQAIEMVKNGELDGYNVAKSKSGTEYLRGDADGDSSNNLDSLPTFE